MSQHSNSGLASIVVSSWENDMSVHMMIADNMHYGSCIEHNYSQRVVEASLL